jgi:hypothetical protein
MHTVPSYPKAAVRSLEARVKELLPAHQLTWLELARLEPAALQDASMTGNEGAIAQRRLGSECVGSLP